MAVLIHDFASTLLFYHFVVIFFKSLLCQFTCLFITFNNFVSSFKSIMLISMRSSVIVCLGDKSLRAAAESEQMTE